MDTKTLLQKIAELENELALLRGGLTHVLANINDTLLGIEKWQKWNDVEALRSLRESMIDSFDEGECHSLCFDLGVNFDSLPGDTLDDKCRELILYQRRRGRLMELVERCRELRPAGRWPDVI